MVKKMPVVHSSASAFNTAGVLTGQGPSSKVSTISLSVRKSSCLKCSKPKPGPPVVSISTTRATPSASGLAHAGFACGAGAADNRSAIEPVVSTSACGAVDLAGFAEASGAPCKGLAGAAAIVGGVLVFARGELVQNHRPVITRVATTLASIRPNASRMANLSQIPSLKSSPAYLSEIVVNETPTRGRFVQTIRAFGI